MMVIEPHVTRGEEPNRKRREGIRALAVVSHILQPASIQDLIDEVEKGIAECHVAARAQGGRYDGLRRVIFVGTFGSLFHRYTTSKLAPGESLLLLPVASVWDELDARKDEVIAALAKFGA